MHYLVAVILYRKTFGKDWNYFFFFFFVQVAIVPSPRPRLLKFKSKMLPVSRRIIFSHCEIRFVNTDLASQSSRAVILTSGYSSSGVSHVLPASLSVSSSFLQPLENMLVGGLSTLNDPQE